MGCITALTIRLPESSMTVLRLPGMSRSTLSRPGRIRSTFRCILGGEDRWGFLWPPRWSILIWLFWVLSTAMLSRTTELRAVENLWLLTGFLMRAKTSAPTCKWPRRGLRRGLCLRSRPPLDLAATMVELLVVVEVVLLVVLSGRAPMSYLNIDEKWIFPSNQNSKNSNLRKIDFSVKSKFEFDFWERSIFYFFFFVKSKFENFTTYNNIGILDIYCKVNWQNLQIVIIIF